MLGLELNHVSKRSPRIFILHHDAKQNELFCLTTRYLHEFNDKQIIWIYFENNIRFVINMSITDSTIHIMFLLDIAYFSTNYLINTNEQEFHCTQTDKTIIMTDGSDSFT